MTSVVAFLESSVSLFSQAAFGVGRGCVMFGSGAEVWEEFFFFLAVSLNDVHMVHDGFSHGFVPTPAIFGYKWPPAGYI